MIGCLRTRVHNQPIIALYFESENVLKFYNFEACLLPGATYRFMYIFDYAVLTISFVR